MSASRVPLVTRGFLLLGMAGLLLPSAVADQPDWPGTDGPAPHLENANAAPGYLGVDIRDVDAARAGQLRLKQAGGAEVVALDRDAPACKAGMRIHDVILAVDGAPIADGNQLHRTMRGMPAGKTITVAVSRAGKPLQIKLKLADREALLEEAWSRHFRVPPPDGAPTIGHFAGEHSMFSGRAPAIVWPGENPWSAGAEVDTLGPQLAGYFGVKDGSGLLVKSVEENSPAAAAGLRAGDVVLRANGAPLANREDWWQTWQANAGKPVELVVVRDRHERRLTLTVSGPRADSLLAPGPDLAAGPDHERLLAQMDAAAGAFALGQGDLDRIQRDVQQAMQEAGRQVNSIDRPAMEKALRDAQKQMGAIDLPAMRKQIEEAQRQASAESMAALQKQLEQARARTQSLDMQGLQQQVEKAQRQAMQELQQQLREQPFGSLPF